MVLRKKTLKFGARICCRDSRLASGDPFRRLSFGGRNEKSTRRWLSRRMVAADAASALGLLPTLELKHEPIR